MPTAPCLQRISFEHSEQILICERVDERSRGILVQVPAYKSLEKVCVLRIRVFHEYNGLTVSDRLRKKHMHHQCINLASEVSLHEENEQRAYQIETDVWCGIFQFPILKLITCRV